MDYCRYACISGKINPVQVAAGGENRTCNKIKIVSVFGKSARVVPRANPIGQSVADNTKQRCHMQVDLEGGAIRVLQGSDKGLSGLTEWILDSHRRSPTALGYRSYRPPNIWANEDKR